MRWSSVVVAGACALVAAGCGSTSSAGGAGDGELAVVAGFEPLAEVARRVGGERVAVRNLTQAGAEPHDLELDPRQVEEVAGADLVVVMGRGFQPGVEQVAADRDGATIEVLDELPIDEQGEVEAHDHGGEEEHGGEVLDPHVWLDPVLMQAVVDEVEAALAEVDPDGAEELARNADAVRADLDELHHRYEEGLAECRSDLLVVQHEAFGWLARRYDLRQEGVAGLSPEQEPDPRRLAELVELVREEDVETVFTETRASPRIAETLSREAGVTTATLDPIETLTDEQREAGADYLSVMEQNLDTLVEALGCRSDGGGSA